MYAGSTDMPNVSGPPVASIVGGTLGGIILLLILVAGLCFLKTRYLHSNILSLLVVFCYETFHI